MRVGQKLLDTAVSGVDILNHGIDFDSIAGRQQNSFLHARVRTEASQGFTETAFGNGQTLPDFYRSRLMA